MRIQPTPAFGSTFIYQVNPNMEAVKRIPFTKELHNLSHDPTNQPIQATYVLSDDWQSSAFGVSVPDDKDALFSKFSKEYGIHPIKIRQTFAHNQREALRNIIKKVINQPPDTYSKNAKATH